MSKQGIERRLTTILAVDVVGYSRLMGEDEAGTLTALKAHRKELIDPVIAQFHGRIIKLMGDGALVEFPSVVEAVHCAIEVQEGIARRNAAVPERRQIRFRMGINIGDVIVDDGDIYGDGVNVAARLEGLASPGGICISRSVRNQVRDKLPVEFADMGGIEVKNIARPLRVFQVYPKGKSIEEKQEPPKVSAMRKWPSLAIATVIVIFAVLAGMLIRFQLSQPDGRQELSELPAIRAAEVPVIAVLPFGNTSKDPDQDYFSDGITEDLINDLSRLSSVLVIARNTMFTYKGVAVSVRDVGRELGVAYVLEGSVRKAGNRIRINAQLVETENERQLWAERYDRELTDVFALQDEITQQIVSALAVRLTGDEEKQLSEAARADPEAYDALLRGLERYRRYTRVTNTEARQFFEKAIALDPDFARAHADLALTHYMDASFGWAPFDTSVERAIDSSHSALALDPSLPQVHFALSDVYRMQKRHDKAIAAARRAIELDPNYADGYAVLGLSLIYAGQDHAGLEATQKAIRLNPRHPFFYIQNLGHAHYLSRQYEEAATAFEKVIESNPHFPSAHVMLAATYGQLGRHADAEWEVAEVLTLSPDFSIQKERLTAQYKNPADLEHYIDGLRKAGLPE